MPKSVLPAGVALALLTAATVDAEVPLGGEFQVNTFTTGEQRVPIVAADAGGNFLVAWIGSGQDGNDWGVFGRRYDDAGTPLGSAEFRVNSHTTGPQTSPAAAFDGTGRVVVVWESQPLDGSHNGIFARRYDTTGAAGPEFRVSPVSTSFARQPSVGADAAGNFVVAYRRQTGASYDVFARRFDVSGVAQGGEIQLNSYTTSAQSRPKVAVAPDGHFVAVWQSVQAGSSDDVFARVFDSSGNPAGPEFRVNSSTTGPQGDPAVAAAPNGNFMVAWVSDPASGPQETDVFGRRYDAAGTAQGGEFRVNSYTANFQERPQVASDADGNFVVVWESFGLEDGNGLAVLGRRYDVSGAAGLAFRLNTYTTGNQAFPSVAADGTGRFVTTWTSPRDGSGSGIAARRFLPDVIFRDGFESTHLGAWSVSSTDGGDLSVSSFAAMKLTTQGLQGLVDDAASIWVQDDSPNDEPRYRARFYLDTNGFDPGEALGQRRTRTFIAFSENPTRRVAALVLRRIGGLYSVSARVRLDDNSQADTAFFPISDGPHVLEISLQRASDADAGNGVFVLFIDNDPVEIFGQLDNSFSEVDFVRLGALAVKGGANGTLYWDEFESRRQSEIGP